MRELNLSCLEEVPLFDSFNLFRWVQSVGSFPSPLGQEMGRIGCNKSKCYLAGEWRESVDVKLKFFTLMQVRCCNHLVPHMVPHAQVPRRPKHVLHAEVQYATPKHLANTPVPVNTSYSRSMHVGVTSLGPNCCFLVCSCCCRTPASWVMDLSSAIPSS
jgi:hypothetical protein